jgi:hypothetical protein
LHVYDISIDIERTQRIAKLLVDLYAFVLTMRSLEAPIAAGLQARLLGTLFLLWVALVPHLPPAFSSSISNPLAADGDVSKVIPDYFDTKRKKDYHASTPDVLHNVESVIHDATCPKQEFKLRWASGVESSVYAPPVLFPSGPEGKRQIFMSTFYEHIEMIGYDGFKPWGWPLTFEGSSFQGSPMLYDIDADGANDIGLIDKNGNFFWIRVGNFGQYLEDYHIQIPKLKIHKEWAKKVDPAYQDNFIMTSQFDHKRNYDYNEHGEIIKQDNRIKNKAKPDPLLAIPVKQDSYPMLDAANAAASPNSAGDASTGQAEGSGSKSDPTATRRRLLSMDELSDHFKMSYSYDHKTERLAPRRRRTLLQEEGTGTEAEAVPNEVPNEGAGSAATEEGEGNTPKIEAEEEVIEKLPEEGEAEAEAEGARQDQFGDSLDMDPYEGGSFDPYRGDPYRYLTSICVNNMTSATLVYVVCRYS